jgi:long-chain acyl-CoA synthetase
MPSIDGEARMNMGSVFDDLDDLEHVALVDQCDPNAHWTIEYSRLKELTTACSRSLVARGLKKGDRVAIVAGNSAEYLIAFLGIVRAGLVAVPMNHKAGLEAVSHAFQDSEIKFAFADRARLGLVPKACPCTLFDRASNSGWMQFLQSGQFCTESMNENDEAAVLYTSGSTGRPKGVPLLHGGQVWLRKTRATMSKSNTVERPVTVVAAPFFHMNGLSSTLAMLAAGGTTVLLPEFQTLAYVEAIRSYRVNTITTVTTMLAMVLRERDRLFNEPIDHVRVVRVGSAPVTQALIDGIREIFPNATVGNAYGITEAGQIIFGPHPDGIPTPPIAVGFPIPGVECRIVDASGNEADEGALWLRSPTVMRGYLNLPEKSLEVLSPDGWYYTKDVFRRDDLGFYYFVGRVDDMFVCGGENIYPSEVEEMLEKHPAVSQAIVVSVPDELKGQKPVAFVVLKSGCTADEKELKSFCLASGPAYQHPRMIVFRESMPWSGTNKIDRKLLSSEAVEAWRQSEQQQS